MTRDEVTKQCTKCGEVKDLKDFYKHKGMKDGYQPSCKFCFTDGVTKRRRERTGGRLMTDNKKCGAYLGIVVAERLCRHLFKGVVQMPYGNPKYDFICSNGKKIDVKASCFRKVDNSFYWMFNIRKNQVADYFLLLAFNNREDIEPIHQWLIPGKKLNHLKNTSIAPATINKWSEYEQPIGAAVECCNMMKGEE